MSYRHDAAGNIRRADVRRRLRLTGRPCVRAAHTTAGGGVILRSKATKDLRTIIVVKVLFYM